MLTSSQYGTLRNTICHIQLQTEVTYGRARRREATNVVNVVLTLHSQVGGFVVQNRDWRWTQWVVLICAGGCYLPILFTRETYKKTILQRRAKKAGILEPTKEDKTWLQDISYFATTLLIRPVHMLFTEPIVCFVCLYNGFIFGLMYTFIIALPWVYQHYYDFNTTAVNLSFLGLIIGTVIVPCPLILIDKYFYQPRLRAFNEVSPPGAQYPPEHRLYPAMLASIGLPASLFIFAWTTRPAIHWICPMFFQGMIMLCNLMVYAPANLYMIDAYGPLYGASAAGAAMLSRYTFSAAFPLFALQLYKGLGVGWATSILGFCALLLAPVPFLFFRYGEWLRSRSKYERST
jgi:DHA1 family multidrug resistance protein-like MFS transporter